MNIIKAREVVGMTNTEKIAMVLSDILSRKHGANVKISFERAENGADRGDQGPAAKAAV